jgi:hypothetical protein
MPWNHCYSEVAAQNPNNAKDNERPVRRTSGILSYTEDQKEHAGNTNSRREVKATETYRIGSGWTPSIMEEEAVLICLFVCE